MCDSLQKIVLVHHDGTPQRHISRPGVRCLAQDERGRGFNDVVVTLGVECDNIQVGLDQCHQGAESCVNLHDDNDGSISSYSTIWR